MSVKNSINFNQKVLMYLRRSNEYKKRISEFKKNQKSEKTLSPRTRKIKNFLENGDFFGYKNNMAELMSAFCNEEIILDGNQNFPVPQEGDIVVVENLGKNTESTRCDLNVPIKVIHVDSNLPSFQGENTNWIFPREAEVRPATLSEIKRYIENQI